MNPARITAIFALAATILAAGCGGGGSASTTSPAKVSPSVSINWPARTRGVVGPSSALSVTLTLHKPGGTEADISFSGDRSTDTTGHSESYTTTATGSIGEWILTAKFYSGHSETSAVVGTATADVDITANGVVAKLDGSLLSVSFTGPIAQAVVNPGQTIAVGGSGALSATAETAAGDPVIVSPGSFSFSLISGSSSLSVTPDGTATGISPGTAYVTASVDGVTSPVTAVNVGTVGVTFNTVNLSVNDLAYDSTRGIVWAPVLSNSGGYSGKVVAINVATGAIVASITTNNEPTHVAISNDGTHLYVAGFDGTVKQIDAATHTILNSISLPSGVVASQLLPIPGSTDTWAVATETKLLVRQNTYIYDGVTARPSSALLGSSIAVDSTGTAIYGYQQFVNAGNAYVAATIDSSGITSTVTSTSSGISGRTNAIHWSNGLIIADDGTVATPATGAKLRQLGVYNGSISAPVSGSSSAYFLSSNPYLESTFNVGQVLQTNSVSLPSSLTGSFYGAVTVGPGKVAVFTNSGTTDTVTIITGLP